MSEEFYSLLHCNVADSGSDGEGAREQQQRAWQTTMKGEVQPVLQLAPHEGESALTKGSTNTSGATGLEVEDKMMGGT